MGTRLHRRASRVLGEQLSGGRGSVQGGCTRCQCISGLATRGGGGSRFVKSAGGSQLPAAKARLQRARLPGTGHGSRLRVRGPRGAVSAGMPHPGTRVCREQGLDVTVAELVRSCSGESRRGWGLDELEARRKGGLSSLV